MTLKGVYDSSTAYSVGDVVEFDDGAVYVCKREGTGMACHNTRYWNRLSTMEELVKFIVDAISIAEDGALDGKVQNDLTATTEGKVLDARQGKALKDLIDNLNIPDNIGPDSILLNSSTASSTKQFLITVDDDGELTATEVVAEGGET